MTINTNPGCLASILSIFSPKKPIKTIYPYELRNEFLSPAELSFYKVLEDVIKDKLIVQCKVRLSDIFYVAQPNRNIRYSNSINQKHIDFLLCNPKNMKPILGIELDDSSHSRPSRQQRDSFVNEVFVAAKLPLLHVKVKHSYNSQELFDQIKLAVTTSR